MDLPSDVVREKPIFAEVSRQLIAMGHDPIGVFHHEAIRLQNGHTLVIASVERLITDVQGAGVVNVYGEMIVDLNQNLQVAWAWNAFDHLDVSRAAVLGERSPSKDPAVRRSILLRQRTTGCTPTLSDTYPRMATW